MASSDTDPEVVSVDELAGQPHAEVFEEPRPRAVRLRLAAGESVPPHTHPGSDVVLYAVDGRIDCTLDGDTYELAAGDAVRFSGERAVSPEAVTDATALVVFAPAPDE